MKHLLQHCRDKTNFIGCAKQQFSNYWQYNGKVEYTTELGISLNHNYDKYVGSKILIIGGGPSTNDCKWIATDYDYIFSCNHFYLAEKLKNLDVDLAVISPEVNVYSDIFQEYLKKTNTLFCIENLDTPLDRVNYLLSINRLCLVSLRLNLKLGTTGRLMIIASHFRPKEIHVVGMDGVPKTGVNCGEDSKHSFQPGKTFFRSHSYDKCLKEFVFLWEYLKNDIGKDIIYKNLGHGHPYNVSTELNIL